MSRRNYRGRVEWTYDQDGSVETSKTNVVFEAEKKLVFDYFDDVYNRVVDIPLEYDPETRFYVGARDYYVYRATPYPDDGTIRIQGIFVGKNCGSFVVVAEEEKK